jgi:uncharacterized protein
MDENFTAFDGNRRFASGSRAEVVQAIREFAGRQPNICLLIFDDATGSQIDFDLRETAGEATAHHPKLPSSLVGEEGARGPGRPKLGVVPREVTLLPRHWEWLAKQPGGASVTLRKLVDDARRKNADAENTRTAQERAYRFMSAMAGNFSGFEEATRALFASDQTRFGKLISEWPDDIRGYARNLAEGAFVAQVESALR